MRKVLSIATLQFLFLLFAFSLFSSAAYSQSSLEIGLSGGLSYYNGDLVPGMPFVHPGLAFGGIARYNFSDRWSAKLTFTQANISGDTLHPKPALEGLDNFTTRINDISATAEFNFMKYSTGSERFRFSPYLTAGAGFFMYNTDTISKNGSGNFKNSTFAAVFGLGFKLSLSKKLALSTEWRMHKTFTDLLDGQEGNSGTNDWFGVANISLTYKIVIRNDNACRYQ